MYSLLNTSQYKIQIQYLYFVYWTIFWILPGHFVTFVSVTQLHKGPPAVFVATKSRFFFTRNQDVPSVFDHGTSPAVFVTDKAGILSQNMILSEL